MDGDLTFGIEEFFKTFLINVILKNPPPFLKRTHILCLKLSMFTLDISTSILNINC